MLVAALRGQKSNTALLKIPIRIQRYFWASSPLKTKHPHLFKRRVSLSLQWAAAHLQCKRFKTMALLRSLGRSIRVQKFHWWATPSYRFYSPRKSKGEQKEACGRKGVCMHYMGVRVGACTVACTAWQLSTKNRMHSSETAKLHYSVMWYCLAQCGSSWPLRNKRGEGK